MLCQEMMPIDDITDDIALLAVVAAVATWIRAISRQTEEYDASA
jgi:hypothetical protein